MCGLQGPGLAVMKVPMTVGGGRDQKETKAAGLYDRDTCAVKTGEICRGPWWPCWPSVSSVGKAAGVLCREGLWGPQMLVFPAFFLTPTCLRMSQLCLFLGAGWAEPKRVSHAAPQKPGGAGR